MEGNHSQAAPAKASPALKQERQGIGRGQPKLGIFAAPLTPKVGEAGHEAAAPANQGSFVRDKETNSVVAEGVPLRYPTDPLDQGIPNPAFAAQPQRNSGPGIHPSQADSAAMIHNPAFRALEVKEQLPGSFIPGSSPSNNLSSSAGVSTWARQVFQSLKPGDGPANPLHSSGRSFEDYYPSEIAPEDGGPPPRSGSRLGIMRGRPQPQSGGVRRKPRESPVPRNPSDAGDWDSSSGDEDDADTYGAALSPGATGRPRVFVGFNAGNTGRPPSRPPLPADAPQLQSRATVGKSGRARGPRKGGGVRFEEDDSLASTAAPPESRMARGGGGAAAVARSESGVDEATSLDLPDGEPISDGDSYAEEGDATEAEEELDDSMPRIPGPTFAPGKTGRGQIKAERTNGHAKESNLLADFRPGLTAFFAHHTGGSNALKATRTRFDATQKTLKPATANLSATGFRSAAQYPTQRLTAGMRKTKKDFSLGVQPAPDDPGVGLGTLKREYQAPPFTEQDLEAGVASPNARGPDSLLGYKLVRKTRINVIGWALNLYYVGALGFYLYTRVTELHLGLYNIYSIAMLVVEVMGASTIVLYGMNLLWDPLYDKFEDDPRQPGTPKVKLPYAIRVLIVCYKEDLECIQMTVQAAAAAPIPYGCSKTIYLCDDGKDKEKREWMKGQGQGYVYVSGRNRPKGETNGKSGNLNNTFGQVYPRELDIPGNEVLCIFDADQMACDTFFLKTVPLLDGGDDIAMILTPQAFHNLDITTDIFNHSNIHFWEYMQPGADTLGFISCTGTNFLVRANAFRKVGGSPQYTMTEDYALGMELKKEGYHCRYVREYLALGEAPHEVRNVFQQRSRWTKGHFQIFFQPAVCPLFQLQLTLGMRLMYSTGIWSYVVCAICTPFFLAIPVVTIWIGVFPLAITKKLAQAATLYIVAIFALLFRVRAPRHWPCLYFAGCCNQILWWAFVKAAYRAFSTRVCGGNIVFKATAKVADLGFGVRGSGFGVEGKKKLKQSPMKDVWVHLVTFVLLTSSVACGIWQMVDGGNIISPLLISVAWAVYGNIAPTLVLWYAFIGVGPVFYVACRVSMVLYVSMIVLATTTLWLIHNYSVKEFNGGGIGLLFKYSGKTLSG